VGDLVRHRLHIVHLPNQYGAQSDALRGTAYVLEAAGKLSLPGRLLPTVAAGADESSTETPSLEVFLGGFSAGAPAAVANPAHAKFTVRD